MKQNSKTKGRKPRTKAEQRRHDTMQAYGVIFAILIVIMGIAVYVLLIKDDIKTANTEPTDAQNSQAQVSSANITKQNAAPADSVSSEADDTSSEEDPQGSEDSAESKPDSSQDEQSKPDQDSSEPSDSDNDKHKVEVIEGRTYIDGILIVNKTYSLPRSYAPGLLPEVQEAFNKMANASWADGVGLFICSGFRSYDEQLALYNGYAAERGVEAADRVSSRAGHSEHQSGLCMDVNTTEFEFEGTPEAIWLQNHCAEYGFIIRFPRGKEDITGYAYEPWHIRYVGVEAATEIMEEDICLEEYLGVTSDYRYSKDQSIA